MLPDLSALNLRSKPTEGLKRNEREGSLEAPETKALKLQAAKPRENTWQARFDKIKKIGENRVFKLTSMATNGVEQTMQFLLERFDREHMQIKMPTILADGEVNEDDTCVYIDIKLNYSTIEIESLFHGLDEETSLGCAMSPPRPEAQNAGNIVLRLVLQIADEFDAKMTLYDASDFKTTTGAHYATMTFTLRVTRGFGFYEKRGFFDHRFYLKEANRDEELPKQEMLRAVVESQTIQLLWVHMLATTPIKDLHTQMGAFYSYAAPLVVSRVHKTLGILSEEKASEINAVQGRLTRVGKKWQRPYLSGPLDNLRKAVNEFSFHPALKDALNMAFNVTEVQAMSLRQIAALQNMCFEFFKSDVESMNDTIARFMAELGTFGGRDAVHGLPFLEKRIYDGQPGIGNGRYVLEVEEDPEDSKGAPVCIMRQLPKRDVVEME